MAERKIDAKTYKVEPLVASEALELYGDILRTVGSGVGRLPAIILGLSGDDGEDMMADVAAIAALTDILKASSSSDVRDLIKRIVETARVQAPSGEWRQLDLDADFTGNLKLILPVAKFVLEVQFADFFIGSAGGGILGLLREVLANPKPARSPRT